MIVKHEFQCRLCPEKKITEYAYGHSEGAGPVIITPPGWLYLPTIGYHCPRHVMTVIYVEGKIVKVEDS